MATSALEYLLSNYFHQDLFDEHGSVEGAISAFALKDPHRAVHVPNEIEQLLSSRPQERDVASFVEATGCEYDPRSIEGGFRPWLQEVQRQINAALARQN